VVLGPITSAAALARGRLKLVAHADQLIRDGGKTFPVTTQLPQHYDLPIVRVPQLPDPAPPVCEQTPVRAHFSRETLVTVVCMGEGVRVRLAGEPQHGEVRLLRSVEQRSALAYTPAAGYVGPDQIPIRAGSARSAVQIDVRPFELRAIGD